MINSILSKLERLNNIHECLNHDELELWFDSIGRDIDSLPDSEAKWLLDKSFISLMNRIRP